ncbi:MAG: ATP-dependent DNA ligase [Ignavibacteriae bacterium]|nr:MAG: ATP-dependent DNA ligase [Ignavibacteriota bacterium]
MKKFAEFFACLDQTNKTNDKITILKDYLESAPDEDKLWTLYLFSGRKIKRQFNSTKLALWAVEYAGIPDWLFNESYHSVGDLAEVIALILPKPLGESTQTLTHWIKYLDELTDKDEETKKKKIIDAWRCFDQTERFVFNKIITGGFRVGISQNNLVRAVAELTGIETNIIAHKLMGNWHPDTVTFKELVYAGDGYDDVSKPYPFFLAHPIESKPEDLGLPEDWMAEWKWDGIRSQVILRKGELFIWTRGEDLVTEKFPELHILNKLLPNGTVIDGEIMCYCESKPMAFNVLQTRIGRKNVTQKILKEAPAAVIGYDIIEHMNKDIRHYPLTERREILESVINKANCPALILSPVINYSSWEELAKIRDRSREELTEGVMLKRKISQYQVGRKKGDWWKWKIDPYSFDGVMIYAQKGHGKRADLFTDYTFAVWDGDNLVTVTKAYSGLTDEEIKEVDKFVKLNTLEKFGPVRTVKPELVFEIAFEGIALSTRHKSGVALRFPRIARWRHDKKVEEADTLENLRKLLS